MDFRILGPLEVVRDGRPLALGGAQQRAVLAVLLINRGEVISIDRLIDELWGERAPPTVAKIIQGYVSHLRKALGEDAIVTRGRGYMLAVQSDQVDVGLFEALVADGRSALLTGDAAAASRCLGEALALWRGEPLADFAYESFAQSEIARLGQARLAVLEDRFDAELALGHHARLVGELEVLVREHPLRERLQAQLMLALYRSGRQAEALESYRVARRRLVDEVGLEPTEQLRQLERAILAQDSALQAPSRRSAGRTATVTRRWRGGWLIAFGVALLLAALAAAVVQLSGRGAAPLGAEPNSVAAIDVRNDSVVAAVPVGTRPGGVAFSAGSVWVANRDDGTVSRVDPRTLRTVRTLPIGGPPTGLAASSRAVWVVQSSRTASAIRVSSIDPAFDVVGPSARIDNVVPGGPGTIAARAGVVWVAPSSGLLTRVDPATLQVLARVDPNTAPTAIDVGDGAVWLADSEADSVTRVDPTCLETPIAVGNGPRGIAVGTGAVWVADSLDDALVRIDPATRAVTDTIRVGHSPAGVAIGAGSVWVANSADGTVSRIDPRGDTVQATIPVGGSPQAITVADGRAWVTVDAQTIRAAELARGNESIRIDSQSDVDNLDPALAYTLLSAQLLDATCVKLMYYADTPAPMGFQLTPEVARSLPLRSPDGKAYTFTIRRGFRFSPPSNQAVTAQTFKDTIERTLNPRIKSPVAGEFADIVGARDYIAGKASHISGIVTDGDTLTVRLVAPAPDFLARIAQPAFCAVPSNTPVEPNGVAIIPSAGPYFVRSYSPGQGIVLARNPNYRGSRQARTARIDVAVGVPAAQAVADVSAGKADYTFLGRRAISSPGGSGSDIAALSSELTARYGPGSAAAANGRQRYFVTPQLQLEYFVLNTHRPLFSNLRLRQALNYALDRRALAQAGNGFTQLPERAADHYLPPGLPGFRDVHVYPLVPDLVTARRLAHHVAATAVLYTCDVCDEQTQIAKNDLAAIGLQLKVKTFPITTLFARLAKPGEPYDIGFGGWLPDYLDPSAMLNPLLEDSTVVPTFGDFTYRRRLATAARLSGPERFLAYGRLDLDLARNAAPLAAIGNHLSYDFFSARLGCQSYGFNGIDLGALCIKHHAP